MGRDAAENVQALQNSSAVKVHSPMCWELTNILNEVICILPVIESARPGFKSGIQELCSLNNAVEKAKLLIQHCTESSKLYLAITGESILLRCERIRSAMNHSLCEIENMVPQAVFAKICDVLDHLRDSKFTIDSKEEEAGKALLQLLGQTNSSEELELTAFQIAAVKLNITSPKAILIERRSIKKLLDKISGTDQKKERILKYFLNLLRKYGKKVRPDIGEHKEVSNTEDNVLISNTISTPDDTKFEKNEPTNLVDSQTDLSCIDVPPEEFCCPISSRLMYDPVVIASGQTYERILIEKWFNDGNDTCPKTRMKLANLSVIPNSCMKDLISNWCRKHGIDLEDPSKAFRSWESSCCSSISSLKNVSAALLEGAGGDYLFQSDHSNVSFISSDASSYSDVSHIKGIDTLKGMDTHVQLFSWSDDYSRYQSFSNFNHDMYTRFFYGLSELPLNLQDKAVEDVEVLLEGDEETCYAMISNGFVEALMMFLKNVHDLSDMQALKVGAQLFLAFLSNNRVEVPSLSEDAFQLLTSFLESEITTEALMILQKLCHHPNSKSIIAVAGVLPPIIKFLDSEDSEFLKLAVKILHDLSSQSEIKPLILSSGCIPKLVPLLGDRRLAEFCLKIMRNLSDIEEAAELLAETNGCLPSIAELLDSSAPEEQEHAVIILLSLCSHSFENCLLVMKEGVIPSLVDISVNGSPQGKESSTKLLRLLRDLRHNVESDRFDSSQPKSGSMGELVQDSIGHSTKKQSNPMSFAFFARKMKLLVKPRS